MRRTTLRVCRGVLLFPAIFAVSFVNLHCGGGGSAKESCLWLQQFHDCEGDIEDECQNGFGCGDDEACQEACESFASEQGKQSKIDDAIDDCQDGVEDEKCDEESRKILQQCGDCLRSLDCDDFAELFTFAIVNGEPIVTFDSTVHCEEECEDFEDVDSDCF